MQIARLNDLSRILAVIRISAMTVTHFSLEANVYSAFCQRFLVLRGYVDTVLVRGVPEKLELDG